jgi:hypothetical protein
VLVSWGIAANATGYVYKIDGGAAIQVAGVSVNLSALSIGAHTIQVAAVCDCAQGIFASMAFSVENPISYTCSAVVSSVTGAQSAEGTATIDWIITGTPATYKYRVDSGAWQTAATKPLTVSGLTPQTQISNGNHIIEVAPVCSNSIAGASGSVTVQIVSVPTISKINETNTGPGGIRTQIFEIGANVNVGNRFVLTIYSHNTTITAVSGDTPTTIATKMRNAINATSTAQWNSSGSAPASGTSGYPPTSTASGNQITVTMNWGNSFSHQAFTS